MKKCRLCGELINEETDKTLCGYGKCIKCCARECGHSLHLNPNHQKKSLRGFRIGDKIKIYQKPLTEEDFEGEAILLRKILTNEMNNTESWRVRFKNGDEVARTIKQ